jgi:hypothetical protein
MDVIKEAELAGFDMSLVDASLRCTPEQRLLQHQQALTLALELEKAGRVLHDRRERTPAMRNFRQIREGTDLKSVPSSNIRS